MSRINYILEKMKREMLEDKRKIMEMEASGTMDEETGIALIKDKYVSMLLKNKKANKNVCEDFITGMLQEVMKCS
jgi:hypothetical protein